MTNDASPGRTSDLGDTAQGGPTEPILRASLHDQLTARLRDMIIDGDLRPGERVPEKALCVRFGVSRTPLRETLKVLASDGLLELLPNRGARVVRLTVADVDELFPIMGALEGLAGEFACAHVTDEEIAEVRALHYQMVLHYTRGELTEYFRLNQQIHECIIDAARNPSLLRLYRSLVGRVRRARYMACMSKARWAQAVEEHEAILAALAARNGARLAQVLQAHLRHKCETVKESLLMETAATTGAADGPRRRTPELAPAEA